MARHVVHLAASPITPKRFLDAFDALGGVWFVERRSHGPHLYLAAHDPLCALAWPAIDAIGAELLTAYASDIDLDWRADMHHPLSPLRNPE